MEENQNTDDNQETDFVDRLLKKAMWFILLPFVITLVLNLVAQCHVGFTAYPNEGLLTQCNQGYTVIDKSEVFTLHSLQALYDPVYQTFILTLAITGILFNNFESWIPKAFNRTKDQGVFKVKKDKEDFDQEYQRLLKSRWRYILGFVFLGLTLVFSYIVTFDEEPLKFLFPSAQDSNVAGFTIEYWLSNVILSIGVWFALFIFGIWIYKLLVTGVMIYRVEEFFGLEIQPAHPDKCGGFKLVGDACLKMVTILMVMALFMSFWLLVNAYVELPKEIVDFIPDLPDYFSEEGFRTPAKIALGLLISASIAVFFWPMSAIHWMMVEERTELNQSLDDIARRIQKLYETILSKATDMSVKERQEMLSNIDSLKEVYESIGNVPTWPFELKVLLKFSTSQIIPIISLLGLGGGSLENIVKLFSG